MASVMKGVASRSALGAACAATLLAVTAGTAHAGGDCTSYAYGLKSMLGPFDTGKVAKSAYPEGPAKADVAKVRLPGIGSVEGIGSTATGNAAAGTTKSTAKVADASLNLRLATLTTDAVTSSCDAMTTGSPVATVRIAGGAASAPMSSANVDLPANPEPNTTVTLPRGAGQLVLNEQIRNRDGSLTVNAVHLRASKLTPFPGDLILASSTCTAEGGQSQPRPPQQPKPPKADLGSITSRAYDTDGARLPGVTFELKRAKSSMSPTCTGDNTGACTFDELRRGTYKVCVVDVPDGYSKPEKDCREDIAINGNHRNVSFVIPKAKPKPPAQRLGSITTRAVDTDGKRLPGVAFELKRAKSSMSPSCTGNSSGACTFDKLTRGTYKVCVIDVPDGYSKPKKDCRGDIAIDGNHRNVKFVIPAANDGKK
ncbi:choice-of-anchor P family protein [Streptomyces sp. Da 82-17]|uniref:choice-of-anchor P family protein n=1 Tax=Streptomyces sp. Da 82-17 TaxID=3377116 RepID=UPI0038D4E58E